MLQSKKDCKKHITNLKHSQAMRGSRNMLIKLVEVLPI